jgi:DNA topoisomerase VI subunit B
MTYVRKRQRIAREGQRRGIFEKYLGEVVAAVGKIQELTDAKQKQLYDAMMETARQRTLQADMQFDEDGNPIPPTPNGGKPRAGKLDGDDNVVIIEKLASDAAALHAEPVDQVAPKPETEAA